MFKQRKGKEGVSVASKALNFTNAMHLASIVIKYFELDVLNSTSRDVIILDLIEKSSADEIAKIVSMFIDTDANTDDSEAMAIVMGSLVAIDLHHLVTVYQKVGFANDA